MKNLYDIVDFYESIKQKDLLPKSVFSVELIPQIEKSIEETNKIFFDLVEKDAQNNKISKRALQITYNKLRDIYFHIDGDLKNLYIDDKAKYTDWSKRSDIKAELKVDLIILLAENDYPPVDRDEVYKEIFEQAENFKKYQGV